MVWIFFVFVINSGYKYIFYVVKKLYILSVIRFVLDIGSMMF